MWPVQFTPRGQVKIEASSGIITATLSDDAFTAPRSLLPGIEPSAMREVSQLTPLMQEPGGSHDRPTACFGATLKPVHEETLI